MLPRFSNSSISVEKWFVGSADAVFDLRSRVSVTRRPQSANRAYRDPGKGEEKRKAFRKLSRISLRFEAHHLYEGLRAHPGASLCHMMKDKQGAE